MIVSSQRTFFTSFSGEIKANGFDEIYYATCIEEAKKLVLTKEISVIIISSPLTDVAGLEFATECAIKKNCAVMMLVKEEYFRPVKEKLSPYEIFVLEETTDKKTLSQALIVLIQTAKKLIRLADSDKENRKAQELKYISRAKMILISSFGMDENQAHKYIEQRAMQSRKTKTAVAEIIINLYGN